jgi:murein tripeptide amidase MpaA
MRRLALLCAFTFAQTAAAPAQERFVTRAEATDYRETPRYDETIDYLRVLEAGSRWVRLETFGTTPEGRPMYVVIVSKTRAFTPESVRREGKLVMLIQNAIHSGECDGKDACLALVRDLAVTRVRPELLDSVVLVIIPVYNIDGHEMMSPYNRINQNGPTEMGFRTTAQNYNLNRDYLKIDAPESRAFVKLWNRWQPDFFIDNHVTDGADFQYAVTYTITSHDNGAPGIRDWSNEWFIPVVTRKMAAWNEPIFPYVITRGTAPDSGVIDFVESPRFSTGYAATRNRPGLLVETHMLKDYRRRVTANYKIMLAVLELLHKSPGPLRVAVRGADSLAARGLSGPMPLDFTRTGEADTVDFLGYPHRVRSSDISGGRLIEYDTARPVTLRVPYFSRMKTTDSATVPRAYLIGPQWTEVIERLRVHDVRMQRLRRPVTLPVERYRFDSVSWQRESFEGHHMVSYRATPFQDTVCFAAGTVVIPTAQPGVRLVMHALEPDAPDAFMRWGFFDTILEQKEYAESYAAEALAVRMLAEEPGLKAEFEARLAADSAFAASPRARWDFFYKRSMWAEPMLNVYPVARLVEPTELPLGD